MNNIKLTILKVLSLPFKPFVGTGFTDHFPFKQLYNLYVKITPHAFVEAKTKYGFKMLIDPKICVDSAIFIAGVWEPVISDILEKNIKLGDTFLDIGANIGYDSLLVSTFVGKKGKVISFEPSPTTFDRINKNVEINNFKNIELHKVGVGDKNFETKIHYNDLNPGGSSILKTDWNKNFKTEIVKIVALDNYLPENIKVDFIKIDIEGFEYEAILGMENILKNNDLKIIFEFSPGVFGKEKGVKLLEKLANLGFKMKHINYEKGNYTEIGNLKEYTDSIKYQSDIFCEKVSKKIQNNTK